MKNLVTNIDTIKNKINVLKQKATSPSYTNYFLQELQSKSFNTKYSNHSIVFFDKDVDFYRLYFFSSDLHDLSMIINDLKIRQTTVDIITKSFSQNLHTLFLESGFKNIALYKRIENKNLPVYYSNENFSFADIKELEFLYERLFNDFDKYTDHFPTFEKLKILIDNKQVIVVRDESKISGYIIYQIQGKKVHLNYWYNEGNQLNSLVLLINFYGLMNEKGIKSGFGWTNIKKQDVIKTHQKIGYKFDGLEDYIYLR